MPILALFAILVIIGAVFGRDNRSALTGEQGYWHLYFGKAKPTTIAIGTPVIADRHRIGSVTPSSTPGPR